jgi:hypothetical protein
MATATLIFAPDRTARFRASPQRFRRRGDATAQMLYDSPGSLPRRRKLTDATTRDGKTVLKPSRLAPLVDWDSSRRENAAFRNLRYCGIRDAELTSDPASHAHHAGPAEKSRALIKESSL